MDFPIESSCYWPQVSQRRIQGTSRPAQVLAPVGVVRRLCRRRSLQDPAGLKTRMKMERLRNIKEQAEMDGGALSVTGRF